MGIVWRIVAAIVVACLASGPSGAWQGEGNADPPAVRAKVKASAKARATLGLAKPAEAPPVPAPKPEPAKTPAARVEEAQAKAKASGAQLVVLVGLAESAVDLAGLGVVAVSVEEYGGDSARRLVVPGPEATYLVPAADLTPERVRAALGAAARRKGVPAVAGPSAWAPPASWLGLPRGGGQACRV